MKRFIHIALLITLITCTKEEITTRAYPRVRTLSVTNITEQGAQFRGSILFTPSRVSDHGFIWSTLPNLDPGNFEIQSLGPKEGTGDFDAVIERSMKKDLTYYVRAYAKTETHEVFGDILTFVSLGSDAPKVTAINPVKGHVFDTVRITGKNFSRINNSIQVRFDTLRSLIIHATDSLLTVIVPETLTGQFSDVSVSVLGNVGKSPLPFELIGPTIQSVSSLVVMPCDTLKITGSNFSTNPNSVQVTLQDALCPILSVTSEELVVRIPTFTPSNSQVNLEVTSSNIAAIYPDPISYQIPTIHSMSPTNITYLDTLTFVGANLPICGSLILTIGTFNVLPIERTKTTVKAIVPQSITTTINSVRLNFDNNGYVYQNSFSLANPAITSINPSLATFGDTITITGDFFHPSILGNHVNIGNAPAFVLSGTRTQLTARINNTSADCSQYNSCNLVSVVVGDRVTDSHAFALKKPVIMSISPLPLGIPETVTITGEFFSPESYNYVELNNHRLPTFNNSTTSIMVDMTQSALSNNNGLFSSSWTGSLWVSIGNADPSRPNSLFSNAVDVQVNYEGPWTVLNPFAGNYRGMPMTFSIDTKAYLIGGLSELNVPSSEVWEYSSTTDTWRRLSDFPGGTRWRGVAFTNNGLGYVGLGQGDTGLNNDMWEFDPNTEVWTRIADLPGGPRISAFCFTTGGNSYVGGGSNDVLPSPTDLWVFVPATKTWLQKQNLPKPFLSGVAFNTNTGGYVAELPELWNYDPNTNAWTQKAGLELLPGYGYHYQATGLADWDRGFILTGSSNEFYMYDPYQDNWTTLGSIEAPGYGRTGFNIGHIYYYGLGISNNGPISDFYKLDISKYPY